MPNMWYIILKAYNSNHSRCSNSMFIRTITFHNTITMMLELAKFLTVGFINLGSLMDQLPIKSSA